MKNKFLYIQTFGCQMNVHDSEQMAALLAGGGYKLTDNIRLADLIILNTCSIREKAAHKVYSTLGRLVKIKEKNQKLIIGVGGCLAQHLGTKFHKKFSHLDFVFGTHNIHRLPQLVDTVKENREKITEIDFYESLNSINIFAPPRTGAVSAFVTIMQGCNNFCAYCVVPYLRGPEMSRASDDILEEIKKLADHGIKEVILLGQNVNSYGKTLGNGLSFTALIKKIGRIAGIERIRFTTSHPRDLSDELIRCFAEEEKLCDHIHLPVQSGSNRILTLMNRGYTVEEYMRKVDHLRKLSPRISITSDIIVGFPGETQNDYQETIDMMEKIRFDSTFSFKYSERKGTGAQKLESKIEECEGLRRLKQLQMLQDQHTLEKNIALENTKQEILVEGRSKNSESDLMGRTSSWKIVNFKGELELIGKMVNVKISKAYLHSLRGKMINKEVGSVN
ncbi:MAG: tRNA (N6-isopentenyl adenosine(37)-C2)-methylthiotransferase MiaB [Deltaproteobacteria bacterium HGW-Deltaproteobacteria-2]|jgi:tRNA-2-methylthio-N6-dimethylallyladenosine synthase|nr:MAG: tRNA (N6-isopentenyl adenosine(37)-C2)-methylthiotransferase MiaB [Deltaproteobacteria bacterium HGW-Deltaproteobacteria-2]